jgi:hypothetical protein
MSHFSASTVEAKKLSLVPWFTAASSNNSLFSLCSLKSTIAIALIFDPILCRYDVAATKFSRNESLELLSRISIRTAVRSYFLHSNLILESISWSVLLFSSPGSFRKVCQCRKGLLKPSSVARAFEAGATHIERVDRLVASIARQHGMVDPAVDGCVETVEFHLLKNRSPSAS